MTRVDPRTGRLEEPRTITLDVRSASYILLALTMLFVVSVWTALEKGRADTAGLAIRDHQDAAHYRALAEELADNAEHLSDELERCVVASEAVMQRAEIVQEWAWTFSQRRVVVEVESEVDR